MSWKVLNWVSENSPTKGSARLLLVMMADMANDEGWLEAKTSTLASRCNVDSERAVQKQIFALAKAGAIQVIPQAADSGRSLNNAFLVLTPGRTIPELRSKAPRVSKRSPSPKSEPESPRVNDCSPSHPVQTDTLTPSERSPSPRPNVHPHKGTVLQEPTERNLTEQQQQPRARDGGLVRPAEEVEALRRNIEQLAEREGMGFDRVALWVTSGRASGRQQCRGTLSFETMSEKHMRRSLVDSNTLLNPPAVSRRVPL